MSRETRSEGLRELMERLGVGAVLLRRPANFAWYTNGADNRVDRSSPVGVASVLATPDAAYVVADNIEAARMRDEEGVGLEVAQYPWHHGPEATIRELVGNVVLGADHSFPGARDVSDAVAPLRYVLDADAIGLYRRAGTETAAAMGEAADKVAPGMSEEEAAAELLYSCRKRGLAADVVLVAADERIARYRHPIPKENPIQRRAMLVVCAEMGGLYVSLTRFVELEEPDGELAGRQAACAEILRRMREEATRPGRTLADAFTDCRSFYAEAGFPYEWSSHHQGGMAGYATREVIATNSTQQEIKPGMAFAWNPSLPGAKAEETFVLTEGGPEVICR